MPCGGVVEDHEVPTQVWTAVSSHPNVMSFDHRFSCAFFLSRTWNLFTCPWHLHLSVDSTRIFMFWKRTQSFQKCLMFFPIARSWNWMCHPLKRWEDFQFEKEIEAYRKERDLSFARDHLLRLWSMWHTLGSQWTPRAQIHSITHMG